MTRWLDDQIRGFAMPTDVVMPQMGESIAEGTIVRWIKKVGDSVDRDEPLFEISTDKVDAEIPAPAAGVLTEIRAKEGETVPVNSVVAVIGAPAPQPAAEPRATMSAPPAPAPSAHAVPSETQPAAPSPAAVVAPTAPAPAAPSEVQQTPAAVTPSAGSTTRQRSSPLVRRIAKEHNLDISSIAGTGTAG